ncbi:PhoH family protein [Methylobacterium sp. AMS5]|uniref:PhoH family protein n=1 Tax=Methylobacterium sp. AMS5 TaxID=925818 RepID=UPI00074F89B0|nr:PhoH family protein [Methylobacterium sp. AMS5]AMB48241.1 phosphate starvation-inducible phoH [Methylobacterium sp. AMS5]
MTSAEKAIARNARRQQKHAKRGNHGSLLRLTQELETQRPRVPQKPRQTPVAPLNAAQREFDALMHENTLTIALGPAGTGKTWFAAARMAERLRDGEIQQVIITRPAVEAGESLGFLPGELDEKFEPYFRPVREAFEDVLGKGHVEYLIKNGTIEARPLALLRGSTFKHADVLLDEAQNTTPGQMKLFLTRIGQDCRVVVNGDLRQKDIPGPSGLADALDKLSGKPGVGVMRFKREDIVRSGFAQMVVSAYETPEDEGISADNDDQASYDSGLMRVLKVDAAA